MTEALSLGKAAYDLLCKPPEKINVIDMQREMQKSVLENIKELIQKNTNYAEEYYIVYIIQRSRIVPNQIRQYFVARKTRPTPDYDTTLYHVDNRNCKLTFVWTIPDEHTCEDLFEKQRQGILSKDDQQLFEFVDKFADGTLV
jgi:hypothetical protein